MVSRDSGSPSGGLAGFSQSSVLIGASEAFWMLVRKKRKTLFVNNWMIVTQEMWRDIMIVWPPYIPSTAFMLFLLFCKTYCGLLQVSGSPTTSPPRFHTAEGSLPPNRTSCKPRVLLSELHTSLVFLCECTQIYMHTH